jgi:predicted phosphodiesterase
MNARDKGIYRFGVVAEIHRAPAGTPRVSWHNEMLLDRSDELLALALKQIAAQQVDAVVLLGDLTSTADDASFEKVREMATERGQLILAVPGNHDAADEYALIRFADHMRGPNITSAPATVLTSNRTAIILTNIERDAGSGELHSAGFPDLAKIAGQTLIVFSHYPVFAMQPRLGDAGLKHSGDLTDRQAIADRLTQHDGPVIVVHGHLHVRASTANGNVLHLSCAALVEPPHEVTMVSVTGPDSGDPLVHFHANSIMTSMVERLPVLDEAHQKWRFTNREWRRASDE